jgi:transposase
MLQRVLLRISKRGALSAFRWPAFSPDLNPIKMVWNWMKDWIQEHYDDRLRGYDELREAIIAAWNAVPEAYLTQLLEEMPAKGQAVIDANGLHNRY